MTDCGALHVGEIGGKGRGVTWLTGRRQMRAVAHRARHLGPFPSAGMPRAAGAGEAQSR